MKKKVISSLLFTFSSAAIDATFSLIKLLLYNESNSNYDLSKVGYITRERGDV